MGIATLTFMNRPLFSPLFLFLGATLSMAILSCGHNTKVNGADLKDSAELKTVAVKDTMAAAKFPPLPIDFDKTKVLKNTYVVDRAGAELRQGADKAAPLLGRYPYGTKLDVIGEEGEWIAVIDRIQRDYSENNGEKGDITR